jgi:hypothetical protein
LIHYPFIVVAARTILAGAAALAVTAAFALPRGVPLSPGQPAAARADSTVSLPFAPGEELTYAAKVGVFGSLGSAVSRVLDAVEMNGEQVYPLYFQYRGRLLLVGLENETRSWLSPATLGSHRFEIREKSPVSSVDEKYEIDIRTLRWVSAAGDTGTLVNDAPLDELSLTFIVRTMPLDDTVTVALQRHFMADRNPVLVRVLGREELTVPAGRFRTVVVETRTPHGNRSGDDRVVVVHLTDDARRLPVRVEKSVKVAGTLVLTLRCGRSPRAAAGSPELPACS